jgi:O-antigen ligase
VSSETSTRRLLITSVSLLLAALVLAGLPFLPALSLPLALVGAGALLAAPELAVYLLVFAVPFGSLLPLAVGGANVTAADGLLLLAWLLYLARGVARRRIELRIPPLTLPFLFFILAAAVSITVAQSLADSLSELAKWIEMLAAYWLVAQWFDDRRVERLLAVMFLAGLSEGLLGVYQYYFRVGPEGFLLFGGTNLRAYGTFEQPNPYAGYLGLILPLAFGTGLGILISARRRGQQFGRRVVTLRQLALLGLAALSFAVMLAALVFSYSRGAWVGVAAAVGVTALLALVRSRRAAAFALGLAVVVAMVIGLGEINVVPNVIAERFATVGDYFGFEDVRGVRVNDDNFAIVERRAHWQAALAMFEDSPWLGVGFGNYAAAYPKYALPKWADPLGHAHNYYLNVLAEAGVVGLVPYLILWLALAWVLWRAARRAQGWAVGVAAGVCGMFVALSIHNFFDNLFVHAMYIQVGLTFGLVEALGLSAKTEQSL